MVSAGTVYTVGCYCGRKEEVGSKGRNSVVTTETPGMREKPGDKVQKQMRAAFQPRCSSRTTLIPNDSDRR